MKRTSSGNSRAKVVVREGYSTRRATESLPQAADTKASSATASSSSTASSSAASNSESSRPSRTSSSKSKASQPKKSDDNERPWVQCNSCNKWRSLPADVDVDSLPEIWYCRLNTWDKKRMTCDAEEERYEEKIDAKLKGFMKVWVKRLRNVDRLEHRLPASSVTRGRKRKPEIEWIRCSNPACGKWRALSARGYDGNQAVKCLNNNRRWSDKKPLAWYCSMNNWDETKASCSAPQEPIYDAPWNLQA